MTKPSWQICLILLLTMMVGCGFLRAGVDEDDLRGLRIEGSRVILDQEYWKSLLLKSLQERGDATLPFEVFRERYGVLKEDDPAAAKQAYAEFRRWTRLQGCDSDFREFWGP